MRPRDGLADRRRLLLTLRTSGRGAFPVLLAVHAVTAVAPAATAVATGALLTRALGGTDLASLLGPLALVAALVLAGQCLEIAREPLDLLVARRIDGRLRADLRRQVAAADLARLDDEGFRTDVARISELGGWRTRTLGTGAVGQLVLLGRLGGAVLCAAVLCWYNPLLGVGLLSGTLLMRATIRRQWLRLSGVWDSRAADRARMEYWADTATGTAAPKEVRLYGLGDWLTARYEDQARGWLTEIWSTRRGILRRQWWTFLLALATGFAALYVPGSALAAQEIGYGDLITMVLAAWGVFAAGTMGYEAFDIEYAVGTLRALDRLGAPGQAPGRRSPAARPVPAGPGHIRFDRVRFSYPGSDRAVLDGLDLEIRPGEVLAVVGGNGAGKTTLLKLLSGLHEPGAGRITVDGVDLADVDGDAWRRRVTVVFQDFLHYPLTARDNIALGAPDAAVGDRAVLRAAESAGAADLVERLPDGLDTLLTREHSGGRTLSGGQWQRIAISRALFAVAHGRRVLVLDEPTAHLDVRAEAEFHDRVISQAAGATVILVSHRLSTVRRADRVVVLGGGRITESGSHDELMDRDGEYARLYRLQACRFTVDESSGTNA